MNPIQSVVLWVGDLGLPVVPLLRAAFLVLLGLVLARLTRRLVRTIEPRLDSQTAMLLRRGVPAILWSLIGMAALNELGFDLKVLLGAAGVLTVAIGFASQTAASNLISGIFLLAERPFVVGDVIEVGGVTGEVVSIDLLSVKLRSFDNLFVRVPSESLIKDRITNFSHFPIRRYDLKLRVDYGEDMDAVRALLLDAADVMPVCLDEPAPRVLFLGFGADGLELQLSVWAARDRFIDLRNAMPAAVKRALDSAGIRMPTNERTLTVAPGDALTVALRGAPAESAGKEPQETP